MQEHYDIYQTLCDAYSEESLNELTAHIIDLYQSGCHDEIKQMRSILAEFIPFDENRINKCYSKLIMTYHPDKSEKYLKEIKEACDLGDTEKLSTLSHILSVRNYKNLVTSDEYIGDIDYDPEYIMDEDELEDGYHTTNDLDEEAENWFNREYNDEFEQNNSFYSAVKRKEYGTVEIDLPSFYFADLEEIVMADFDIDSLGGIEYCVNLLSLDLSRNKLFDIEMLHTLTSLHELYLSDNQICTIEALINMQQLKIVDLSNNHIDDISVLLQLEKLEYVNLSGNRVPLFQINLLRDKQVLVID